MISTTKYSINRMGYKFTVNLTIFPMNADEAIHNYDLDQTTFSAGGYRINATVNKIPCETKYFPNLNIAYASEEFLKSHLGNSYKSYENEGDKMSMWMKIRIGAFTLCVISGIGLFFSDKFLLPCGIGFAIFAADSANRKDGIHIDQHRNEIIKIN